MESQISIWSYLLFSLVVLVLSMFSAAITAAIYTFGLILLSSLKKKFKKPLRKMKKIWMFVFHYRTKTIKINFTDLAVEKTVLDDKVINIVFCLKIKKPEGVNEERIVIPKELFSGLNRWRRFSHGGKIYLHFRNFFWGDWRKHPYNYEVI